MTLEAASIIVLAAATLASIGLIANSLRTRINKRRRLAQPPQPPAWPIIGHLHLLTRSKQPIQRFLFPLSERYGPIIRLQLGFRPVLVVSSSDLAKECFTTNDKAFASRPRISAGKHLGYDFKILSFSPYDSYWRNIRKNCSLQLFTAHRLESFRPVRTDELSRLIRSLLECSQKDSNPMKIGSRVTDLTFNIIVRMTASKRFSPDQSLEDLKEAQEFKEFMEETFLLLESFDVGYYLPFLKWIDPHGIVSAMKNVQRKREVLMKKLVEEHREKRGGHAQDVMDVLISATDNGEIVSDNNDDVVKATALSRFLQVMISAGTETSAVTVVWALSALMNNPHILEKAQEELDTHVGRDRPIEESDLHKLRYLEVIVKETLRLYPPAPALLPHESTESCTVGGYDVPAGTQLLVNAWAIHRDPALWQRPTEFIPERFLNSGKRIDVKGHDFELIPFGSGRRVCPGMPLALIVVRHTLGRLLQSFDWFAPEGTEIDMTEGPGLTMHKLIPLETIIKPRLPLHLY